MKLNKIFLFVTVAIATVLASCSSSDSYEPGKPAGQYNIGFATTQSNQVLSKDATQFTVTMSREGTSGSVTVPVTIISAEGFSVPESVTFAEGASTVDMTITLPSDMAVCTDYDFAIRIPEEYTNPYKKDAYLPEYKVTVTKEDYTVESTGTFNDTFWYEDSWNVDLEYSESMGLYRIKSLLTDGYHLYFKWNKDTNVINVTDATGTVLKYWQTGIWYDYYSSYIVAYVNQAEFYYDPAEKTIHFPFYWYMLNIGGWGIYEDTLVLN